MQLDFTVYVSGQPFFLGSNSVLSSSILLVIILGIAIVLDFSKHNGLGSGSFPSGIKMRGDERFQLSWDL